MAINQKRLRLPSMNPSTRFKDAFKLALAMVITYAIALSQGWESPFWAGLAVAFCSLTGVGESLNKGMLRVFGTLFGAMMAASTPSPKREYG